MLEFFRSRTGVIIISIIWGLGLATIFRSVCVGKDCVVVKAPDAKEVSSNTFSFGDNKCYKFDTVESKCTSDTIKS